MEGLYLPRVLSQMQKGEKNKRYPVLIRISMAARSKLPSLQLASTWPCTCSPGRGFSIQHDICLFASSFLWGMVHAYKVIDYSYFISEMCRAEAPEFFLKYFKANYVAEPLMPAPRGISFECSYLESLCNLTQLSKKPWNPKEQRYELGMKVGAGKEVFSQPGYWVILHYDNAQFNFQRKMLTPGTVTSVYPCLSLWTRNLLMRCSRGITKP